MVDLNEIFMRRALELAREASEAGEVPVGAVIVKDRRIISEGRNRREETGLCTSHAEIEAIEGACRVLGDWRLDGCALYVTLEPCPMCSGALAAARIQKIYYGAKDSSLGALGGSFFMADSIQGWEPKVEGGLLENECSALLSSFFACLRKEAKPKRLTREFYARPADAVARELLGKRLCVIGDDGVLRSGIITETEAYFGYGDSASHASRGKTERNRPMFSKGGTVYIYLCYGIHNMLNIVSGEKGIAEAVLIRGIEGNYGPGKLTRALGIDRRLNEYDVVLSDRIYIEDTLAPAPEYTAGPRIGIGYATPEDQARPLRFTVVS